MNSVQAESLRNIHDKLLSSGKGGDLPPCILELRFHGSMSLLARRITNSGAYDEVKGMVETLTFPFAVNQGDDGVLVREGNERIIACGREFPCLDGVIGHRRIAILDRAQSVGDSLPPVVFGAGLIQQIVAKVGGFAGDQIAVHVVHVLVDTVHRALKKGPFPSLRVRRPSVRKWPGALRAP